MAEEEIKVLGAQKVERLKKMNRSQGSEGQYKMV